ncbi:MAG TPA: hypothetical protein VGC58_01470 [Candidatus Paceibacterota bacterium]
MSELILSVELRLLAKLVRDHSLDEDDRATILKGLEWFKATCRNYVYLWMEGPQDLTSEQIKEANSVFCQMAHNLNRDSRSCFSNGNFFGKVRFLLEACKKLGVDEKRRKTFLKWLLEFPITEEDTLKRLFENELYPSNLPHVYMHMAAGFVRSRLVTRITARQLSGQYRTFQRELYTGREHSRWFSARLPGSYGSRQ